MPSEYVLEMNDIYKSFPGVNALQDVSLKVKYGEVHALVGENGAGKSTLMKTLMGIYMRDAGEILLEGKEVNFSSPHDAITAGISMIHQELSPLPDMTITENIYVGKELKKGPFLDRATMEKTVDELLKEHRMSDLRGYMSMGKLSVGKMQMIEIVKASFYASKIIVMDEPTSSLSNTEVDELFSVIKELKSKGVAIIYISHRMEEVFQLADSVTIMRDGNNVDTLPVSQIDQNKLISLMIGREISQIFPKIPAKIGDVVFEAKHLKRRGLFEDISFSVRKGEILGVAGLVGAGRSEVMRAIFGIDALDAGQLFVDGKEMKIKKPSDTIKAGMGFVTEDRKMQGLVLCLSIKENIMITNLDSVTNGVFVNAQKEQRLATEMAQKLSVKMSSIYQVVENLSGGNQQKVVIAKWLQRMPKILILDEPTRGIDVGAKSEIHRIMSELAGQGMAIIMVSSEMPEILGMSDRVIVLGKGELRAEFSREEATQDAILKAALN